MTQDSKTKAAVGQPHNLSGNLTLRNAQSTDGPKVLKLVSVVLSEFGLEIEPDGIDSDLQDIESSYLRNGGTFLVIEAKDGTVVGSIGLFRDNETRCELRKMYLAPEFRGRGLGKYLLQYVMDWAREAGFKRMTLETSSKLRAANALYCAFGFRPATHQHPSTRADQAYAVDL